MSKHFTILVLELEFFINDCMLFVAEQLNILLAILVEGYMQVKSQSDEKKREGRELSITYEVLDILSHEAKRLCKIFWPLSGFLSDEETLSLLTTQLNELDGSFGNYQRAVHDYELITFTSNAMAIKLEDGMQINRNTLHNLLFGDKTRTENSEMFPRFSFGRIHSSSEASSEDMYLSSYVTNMLLRFGKIQEHQDLNSETIELLQLDTIRRFTQDRLASLQSPSPLEITTESNVEMVKEIVANDHSADIRVRKYKIKVVIQKARNLPRMDVFRGADAFCALFLEGVESVYQTDIKRGKSEEQWNWEREGPFPFEVEETAFSKPISQHKLVVVVYDKDQVNIFWFCTFYIDWKYISDWSWCSAKCRFRKMM
jgi:hypothetical protein